MLTRGDRQHDIAAYFGVNAGRIAWVPISLAEDNRDGTITVPLWLAHEKGLI
jgi:hypothetical protein